MNTNDPPTWYERVLELRIGPLSIGVCLGVGPYAEPPGVAVGWRSRTGVLRGLAIVTIRRDDA